MFNIMTHKHYNTDNDKSDFGPLNLSQEQENDDFILISFVDVKVKLTLQTILMKPKSYKFTYKDKGLLSDPQSTHTHISNQCAPSRPVVQLCSVQYPLISNHNGLCSTNTYYLILQQQIDQKTFQLGRHFCKQYIQPKPRFGLSVSSVQYINIRLKINVLKLPVYMMHQQV